MNDQPDNNLIVLGQDDDFVETKSDKNHRAKIANLI